MKPAFDGSGILSDKRRRNVRSAVPAGPRRIHDRGTFVSGPGDFLPIMFDTKRVFIGTGVVRLSHTLQNF